MRVGRAVQAGLNGNGLILQLFAVLFRVPHSGFRVGFMLLTPLCGGAYNRPAMGLFARSNPVKARWVRAAVLVMAAAAGGLVAAGCNGWGRPVREDRRRLAIELADALRQEALQVPDEQPRERLVTGLGQLRDVLIGDVEMKPLASGEAEPMLPEPAGGLGPIPPWATLFAPRSLVIGFFTRSRSFDQNPGDDGLEVRLQPIDQFGDPTKAVGSYRIEAFAYQRLSTDKRGRRLGHWFVAVLDAPSNRTYYDPIDRSYVFPLLWEEPLPAGMLVIVQATYYPPGGFEEKLIAQRVIKIGAE